MAKQSSQKFIQRNRAPRVQIEYDLEVYGAEKKINLPFVMGVMADLSGKPAEALPPVSDNKLLTARTQLANLLSYMDGKSKAEDLLSNVLKDNSLLQALAAAPAPAGQAGGEEKK